MTKERSQSKATAPNQIFQPLMLWIELNWISAPPYILHAICFRIRPLPCLFLYFCDYKFTSFFFFFFSLSLSKVSIFCNKQRKKWWWRWRSAAWRRVHPLLRLRSTDTAFHLLEEARIVWKGGFSRWLASQNVPHDSISLHSSAKLFFPLCHPFQLLLTLRCLILYMPSSFASACFYCCIILR